MKTHKKLSLISLVVLASSSLSAYSFGEENPQPDSTPTPESKPQAATNNSNASQQTTNSNESVYFSMINKENKTFMFDEDSKVDIKFVYMLPSKRQDYLIQVDKNLVFPEAFDNPLKPKNDTKKNQEEVDKPETCTYLNSIAEKLAGAKSESEVPKLLQQLELAKLTYNGYSDDTNCQNIYTKMREATTLTKTIDVKKGYEYTISVKHGEQDYGKVLIRQPKSWLTHTGFAFLDNKDEEYFSDEITSEVEGDPSTYEVTKANSTKDVKYAAMALFTYPLGQIRDGLEWGFTAGIGTDSENISVGVGASLIIRKNVLLSLAAVTSEFDVLKGRYVTNSDLGETLVESDDLVEAAYKPTVAVMVSFRFGD